MSLLQKPKQRLSWVAFFFGAVNLIEMSSTSAGCILPLLKLGADRPQEAAPGSSSNAKQPLSFTRVSAPGCCCQLFCHVQSWHRRSGGGAASRGRTAGVTARYLRGGWTLTSHLITNWPSVGKLHCCGLGGRAKQHLRGKCPESRSRHWRNPRDLD